MQAGYKALGEGTPPVTVPPLLTEGDKEKE
jgi:hypothetical protein